MARDLFEEAGIQPTSAAAPRDLFADAGIQPQAESLTRTDRLVKGMRDPIDGGAQLLTNLLPTGLVKAGDRLNNWIADNTGLVGRLPEGGVDQQVRDAEKAYQSSRGENSGFDGYRVLGNVISPANLAIAARAPQAVTLTGRIATGAGMGGVSSLLNPVMDGDFTAEKLKQVGTGAAFGGALPVVTSAVGRVVSPNASTNPQLQMLRAEGVKPTIGQTLGGFANAVEEKATSIPLMGDAIAAARSRSRDQFNRAALNRVYAPIGGSADEVGNAGVAQAQDAVSGAYTAAKNALGNVRLDRPAISEIRQIQSMVSQLPKTEQTKFNSIFNTIKTDVSPNGTVLAENFKRIDSKLGKEAAQFSGSSDAYQQQLGDALTELRKSINGAALRGNPDAAQMMRNADKAYANLVRVEGAAKNAQGGVFTPGQLGSAVRQADQSVRDRATAGGKALMQDLSSAGQSVLGNKVPNSGTADRLWLGGAGLGAGLVNPLIPAGLLGGAVAYTPAVQSLLRGAVAARPQQAQAVRSALLKASPGFVPASAQVGLGLLE